jgi:hypothetical protein
MRRDPPLTRHRGRPLDLWTTRRTWQQPNDARLLEFRRGLARVERKRFALNLREIQRRRRLVAGLLFGLLSLGEYSTALAAVPTVRHVAFVVAVRLSHAEAWRCHN